MQKLTWITLVNSIVCSLLFARIENRAPLTLEAVTRQSGAVVFSEKTTGEASWDDVQNPSIHTSVIMEGRLQSGLDLYCRFDDEYLTRADLAGVLDLKDTQPGFLSWQKKAAFTFTAAGARRAVQDKPIRQIVHDRTCIAYGPDADGDETCVEYGDVISTTVHIHIPIAGFRKDRGQRYFTCSKEVPGEDKALTITRSELAEISGGRVRFEKRR